MTMKPSSTPLESCTMEEAAKTVTPEPCHCQGCNVEFKSRNAVFTHLIQTNGACLNHDDYNDFKKYVLANRKRQKVMILYGYLPGMDIIKNGHDAALLLLTTLARLYDEYDELTEQQLSDLTRVNRSYGHTARSTTLVQQDEGTGAISEVLATRLPVEANSQNLGEWLKIINGKLSEVLAGSASHLQVFGKLDAHAQFNAEMDVAHRRIECLFPVDLLVNFDDEQAPALTEFFERFPSLFDGSLLNRENFPNRGNRANGNDAPVCQSGGLDQDMAMYLYALKKTMQSLTTNIVEVKKTSGGTWPESNLSDGKRIRERKAADKQRKNRAKDALTDTGNGDSSMERNGDTPREGLEAPEKTTEGKRGLKKGKGSKKSKKSNESDTSKFTLQRRRYHNFTPTAMAHEYLCLRRMDRFYHRATLRFDTSNEPPRVIPLEEVKGFIRPYMVLSLTGDIFLNGQAARVFGVFSALARGLIDKEFIDCVFDEKYPHLVPTPALPAFAAYAGEALYTKWEGKMQSVLSPRRQDIFKQGWNDSSTLSAVEEWTTMLRQHAAKQWYQDGLESDGRLVAEKKWTNEVLVPWAQRASKQLEHYREWKRSCATLPSDGDTSTTVSFVSDALTSSTDLGILATVDHSVPPVFQEVLYYLRKANESGLWPSTTPKRQLVMVSTVSNETKDAFPDGSPQETSLSTQCIRAKNNARSEDASAYIYEEGQGGASGSFSVGAMPGNVCTQPKGNTLFPELMKAAFQLEIALCPDREPSSTIAINRNAQFKPHTDSGAGAGQSTSLIAGLGTYSGGELVVEGEQRDIRYQAIEFNGWKQRHWTMPFVGERFSLVWFTPKGCEGVRGIDLCR